MIKHFAPLDPEKTDPRLLHNWQVLRLSDAGARMGFGLSVLDERGLFRTAGEVPTGGSDVYPLLTWPFLDFLSACDLKGQSLLELGAGHSTLWFQQRFATVRSFETNPAWCQTLSGMIEPNVELSFRTTEQLENADVPYKNEDWMLVDFAGKRTKFLHSFFSHTQRGCGPRVVVLDNADCYRRGAAVLNDAGYIEVPFYGFKATQAWLSCTSLFFDPARCSSFIAEPFFRPPFTLQLDNQWDVVE